MLPGYNIKSIEFSLRNEFAYVCPSSLTIKGLRISTPPFIKENWSVLNSDEKFEIIKHAFEEWKRDIPMPEDREKYSKSVLEAFGVKTWKKLYSEGRHCSIALDLGKQEYQITPDIYLPENGGLYGIKKGIEVLSTDSSADEFIATLEKVCNRIPELAEEYFANESSDDEEG